MSTPTIANEVREVREATHEMLPARDFTRPGPHRMTLEQAAHKIAVEYSEALALLGKI